MLPASLFDSYAYGTWHSLVVPAFRIQGGHIFFSVGISCCYTFRCVAAKLGHCILNSVCGFYSNQERCALAGVQDNPRVCTSPCLNRATCAGRGMRIFFGRWIFHAMHIHCHSISEVKATKKIRIALVVVTVETTVVYVCRHHWPVSMYGRTQGRDTE